VQTQEAVHWLESWITEKKSMPNAREREGYDEMLEKLLSSLPPEQVRRHYKPEERLAGLAPEERLAGLAPEEQILALSDEVLRNLSDAFVRTLPRRVQQEIRKRLGK
jgi:predicted nucleotidyltransferase